MAFEPIYDVIHNDYKKRILASQIVAECRLTPQEGVAIAKVLSIASMAGIDSFETLQGEARYSGKVNFRVLFVDNEGANHTLDYNATFLDKLVDEQFSPSLRVFPSAVVLDTDTVSVNAQEIKLAAAVELRVDALVSTEIRCLVECGKDIYTREQEFVCNQRVSEIKEDFTITEQIEPKMSVVKIISCDSSAICDRVKCGLDVVTIEGRVFSNICFETEGGLIKSIHHNASFTQELSAPKTKSEHCADLNVRLNNYNAVLERDISGEKNVINLEYAVHAFGVTYGEDSAKAVVDAFSVKNELNMDCESVEVTRFLFQKAFNDRVEGTATLELDMPEIDNILSVCPCGLNITGAYGSEGAVVFEGVLNTAVIYYNASQNSKNSIAVELPFSLSFGQEDIKQGYLVMAEGVTGSASAKIKRANEVELSIDICFNAAVFNVDKVFVIKEMSLGSERKVQKSAIAIYVTRGGENLWDVAKALMSTPELILAQNPSLKLPLNANERVLVYKQLEAEFNN